MKKEKEAELKRLERKVNLRQEALMHTSASIRKLKALKEKREEQISQQVCQNRRDAQELLTRSQHAEQSFASQQCRDLDARIARAKFEETILTKERDIHALIRIDLEDQIEQVKDKIRSLESSNSL